MLRHIPTNGDVLMTYRWVASLASILSANYAFKPTAEQALRSSWPFARRRLNAALEFARVAVTELVKRQNAGREFVRN